MHGDLGGSGELEDLQFYAVAELGALPVAGITRHVLVEFTDWLALSPQARARRGLILFSGMADRGLER